MREDFAQAHPDLVRRVLGAYEEARRWSLAHPSDLKRIFGEVTKLPPAIVDRQIDQRTELTHSVIGAPQRESILAAGLALQSAGVIEPKVDVKASVEALIDPSYLAASTH